VVLVAVGLDGEVGVLGVGHAPQCAALPGGAPARLVHVQRRGATQTVKQIVVGGRPVPQPSLEGIASTVPELILAPNSSSISSTASSRETRLRD
jgi:ABC-type Fe3+-hydroxamate transport system substrate-binding protein